MRRQHAMSVAGGGERQRRERGRTPTDAEPMAASRPDRAGHGEQLPKEHL